LRLPDSKTGEKTIHLSPAAVRLLKHWPRWASSDFVFPGTRRGVVGAHLHSSTLSHAWDVLRTLAQLPDVRLYDACRHSFASVALSKHGLSLAAIGEQLGHSQPATTARYAHLHDEIARANAIKIGRTIAVALCKQVKR
jgi:integrase